MNIPNALTLLRIFFVPLLVAALVQESLKFDWLGLTFSNHAVALCIFLVAAFTDLLDGYLARRWNQITTVGMLLDPIADKLLISAGLIALVQVHRIEAWIAIVIIGREFAVTGLRSIASSEGYTIGASDLGKGKMVAQVAAVALLLGSYDWKALEGPSRFALWAVMLFALISAFDYFRRFWRALDESVKARRRGEVIDAERAYREHIKGE